MRVSTDGGSQVRWHPGGGELYFVAADGRLMAVNVAAAGDGRLDLGRAEALFPTRLATGANVSGSRPQYVVARDGRFLLNSRLDDDRPLPITVVLNWRSLLQPPQ
jgi:hypothetical protein